MQLLIHFCESRQVNASKYRLKRASDRRGCVCVRIIPEKSDGSSNDVNRILLNTAPVSCFKCSEKIQTNPHQVIESSFFSICH